MNEDRDIYAGFTAQPWETNCPACRGQGKTTHIMMCADNITHGNPVTISSLDRLKAI